LAVAPDASPTAVHFARTLRVPVPAAELFAWHERPGAFERLAPPWQRVEVLETAHSVRDGARVRLRARVAPPALAPFHSVVDPLAALVVPAEWLVEHRDYVAGRRFRDVMLAGPFARWTHLHEVEPDGDAASRLTDTVDYALPFGPVGAAVGGRIARGELDRLFAYRHAVTAADLARHADARARGVESLTVAVTGASGLIGSALVPFLTAGGHQVVRIGRGAPPTRATPAVRDVQWDPTRGALDAAALEGVDVVVHLAGANVGGRWTAAYKDEIARSRVDATQLLARALARLSRPPRALVSMSAVGYYGDRGDEVLDDGAPPGRGFLAEVAQRWEAAADPARAAGIRVVHPRLGVVLTPRGGALAKLLPPFSAGVGGPTGSGRQWWSVIGLDDVVGALHFLATHDTLAGPVNLALPEPVRNADFAHALGHVLGRPALLPTPAFALRLALGREQADEMLLASQRVVPRRLLDAGFAFGRPTVEQALRFELGR
jgi:uncharacterized protein (TIGR01777 family)